MDNFRFITSITNPCGTGPTLEEYAAKILKQAAGVAAPEKDDSKESDTEKGQVISDKGEAGEGHQDGESVKGKIKEAAGKAKAEDCDGEGIQISLDADQEFQKGESVDGSKVTPDNKKTEAKPGKKTVDKKEAPKKDTSKKDESEEDDESEEKEDDKEEKEASSEPKWTKISNLNAKEKKMLRNFWNILYPREYVDAMVQDK